MLKIKVLIDLLTTTANGNLKKKIVIFDRGKTSNPCQGAGKKVTVAKTQKNKQLLPKRWTTSNRFQSYKEQLPRAENKKPLSKCGKINNRSQSCEEPSPSAGKLNKAGGNRRRQKGGSHTAAAGECGVENK